MRLLAPAKINLHLRVGPPRADGLHPLFSWMCTVGLFDEITLEHRPENVSLECDDPHVPLSVDNLIVRAAMSLKCSASIKLVKRIPMGGGLAGGSSDAARTLLGLNQLHDLKRPPEEIAKLAAKLGSDVSFFLHGPSSICTGVGECVRPIPAPAARWALLILPPIAMATPRVYKRFDEMKLGKQANLDEADCGAWAKLSAKELLEKLVNDLEIPAFDLNPDLRRLHEDCQNRLGRILRMSGSGSTLFTLFDEEREATEAAGKIAQRTCVAELAPTISDDLVAPSKGDVTR